MAVIHVVFAINTVDVAITGLRVRFAVGVTVVRYITGGCSVWRSVYVVDIELDEVELVEVVEVVDPLDSLKVLDELDVVVAVESYRVEQTREVVLTTVV